MWRLFRGIVFPIQFPITANIGSMQAFLTRVVRKRFIKIRIVKYSKKIDGFKILYII
jgi:hypothetical protein